MVTIDASNMSSKNLNKKIRELAHEVETITVINPQAQHNIAVALFTCITINIEGSVGYFAGSMGDGPQITIEGNAGWALGENMMSGKIVVRKDAGASAASTISTSCPTIRSGFSKSTAPARSSPANGR